MTMDGGQVDALGLFITNLVAAHLQCSFTAGIFRRDTTHNHSSFGAFLTEEILGFAEKISLFPPSRAMALPFKQRH
jgi:hypothetical protein